MLWYLRLRVMLCYQNINPTLSHNCIIGYSLASVIITNVKMELKTWVSNGDARVAFSLIPIIGSISFRSKLNQRSKVCLIRMYE